MVSGVNRIYRFAEFTLNTGEQTLLRGTDEVYLQPKTFETLVYLVERHGHLVKKNELLDALWADTYVTENALMRCIKEVREALQDDAHQPRFIKTVPRIGYKFIANVEDIRQQDRHGVVSNEPVKHSRFSSRQILLLGLSILILASLAFFIYRSKTKEATNPSQINSIAVLPFKPLVADARDESLEMGMADSLIAVLGNLNGVTVRPISAVRKYTGLDQDALAAGREQRVDAVLEGNIQKTNDEIRVTVRLLRVTDGVQLWSDKFDQKSNDIFLIQDSISQRVAATLANKLSGSERQLLTKHHTQDPAAYQLYLKGRYFLNKSTEQDFRKAIEYFESALQKDPNYAAAYAGVADAYAQLGSFGLVEMKQSYERAKDAIEKALERDDKLAEAHASLGYILTNYYWNWSEAESQFKQAIDLNPNYAMAHNWYSQYLGFMGRPEEALRESKRAQEIDPLSPWTNSGFISFLARRYDEGIAESQKALELDPQFAAAHMVIGLSYVQKKDYEQAIAELQRAQDNPDSRALLGYAYGVAGKRNEARQVLEELQQVAKEKYVSPFPVAATYVGLGETDKAFEMLEKAYVERSWAMGMLKVNPIFDPIRSDRRYVELLRRMNLPQ
ncbi:MAG TPA: tetratricopeptide repeat protein [Pyrinomonadaceae bacterium]|nr:tetratricopeptide repeat protein [Pyrinomonadaceae bacterium]